MLSLIKPGYWKILQLFYNNKPAKLHIREIARKAGLHEPSTTIFLKALEKDGILKSEKDGNQKKYFLKLNYKSYAVLQLFDLERFNALPSIRRNAIRYFLSYIREKPLIAFIFGSTAKGTFKSDSDIDILIITNAKTSAAEAEKHSEALTGIRINTLQMTLVNFSKEVKLKDDMVIQAAITSGYPVFNHMHYYGIIYNEY